jgi:hypothetical protein
MRLKPPGSAIPAYFLHGEALQAPDERLVHIETIAARSSELRNLHCGAPEMARSGLAVRRELAHSVGEGSVEELRP